MTADDRRRLSHVVLPRRLPGLALLERYFPSPADNLLDAELTAFAARWRHGPRSVGGDRLDGAARARARHARHRRRSEPFRPARRRSAFLQAPDPSAIDAAFGQLAAARRVDVPLRQHLDELYASHCAACRRPVVAEQFVWPRGSDAPARKVYRCEAAT